ncbi:hypothetical protein B0H17DRAFT_1050471 [Mycena rosella]|uniref:HCP-like protein n=1 Tax=Mycena rosella TaxID=1033263 RepID=A0AAD7DTN0_MYCRO|nr:hypothetical protein B0H17DRAFT_1050471 [Mycena rosella]
MALAFRYWSALPIPGALEDCNRAVGAYERAKGLAFGGAPCGLAFAPTPTRVSGLAGGDRPTMASAAPPEARGGHAAFHASGGAWDDILEYYLFNADRRELEFAYRLAKTSYHGRAPDPSGFGAGAGFVPRDFARARHYFAFVARAVWPEDPLPPFNISPFPPNAAQTQAHALAASSASFLGRMHLRGEGAPADAARAHAWFARGAAQGDARCLNAMGEMWRDGLVPRLGDAEEGGPDAHANTTTPRPKTMAPDPGKAMRYFAAAARQGLPEAQLNLARHHFARGELQAASALFDAVLVRGSGFEAYYYLGQGPDAGPAL